MMSYLRTYERQIDEVVIQYLVGAFTYPIALHRLHALHLSTTEAKEELRKAVLEAAEDLDG